MENNGNVDLLRQNYRGMSITGKKKLIEVSEQFLKIRTLVNEEKPPEGDKPDELKLNNEKLN